MLNGHPRISLSGGVQKSLSPLRIRNCAARTGIALPMPYDAQRFRDRALDCRNLAKSARTLCDAAMLEELAYELDGEARNLEERLKKISKQKPQGDGVH